MPNDNTDPNQDPTKTNQDPNADPTKNQGKDGGAEPQKNTDTSDSGKGSDLSDEQIEKLFDDERLYKHPRFKTLRERAQTAEQKLEETQKLEEERKLKRLEKKGKIQELADAYKTRAEEAENRYQTALIDNKLQAEAIKGGAVDLEAVLKLVDRNSISIDKDGNISGVEEAITGLLESKPYLKGASNARPIGTGTNPSDGDNSGAKTFTRSQIEDPAFYKENEKDILNAMKQGRIIDDKANPQN